MSSYTRDPFVLQGDFSPDLLQFASVRRRSSSAEIPMQGQTKGKKMLYRKKPVKSLTGFF